MALAACPSESTHLLVNTASEDSSSPLQQKSVCISQLSKHLCLPSKAAILILLWTAVVGIVYYTAIYVGVILTTALSNPNISLTTFDFLPYAILAIIMMFYPLSGFIADVCCGRLKTIAISLIFLLIMVILISLGLSVFQTIDLHNIISSLRHNQGILVIIIGFLTLISFVIGLVGYQANFIQLGLDQLFEAPSQYLGLFIHYATWVFQTGSIPFTVTIPLLLCSNLSHPTEIALLIFSYMALFVLTLLLLIGCWKQHWFLHEPGHQNPYRNVYNIVKYAQSHKHPLRRSAFTHCDNYIPSRLDFAKERFGGPFTTEQVENVKTFLRILLLMLMMGPIFVMEVPASLFVFPLFGLHTLHHKIQYGRDNCTSEVIWELFVGSGSTMALLSSMVLFPGYIFIMFSLFRKKLPKFFIRLGIGIVLWLLGVVSLLVTDFVGHRLNRHNPTNSTQCVFQTVFTLSNSLAYPILNMHWGVLIPSNLLLGIGPLMVIATTLEFISAQSPQSMKGLLVGVFFAIRGLFQFLNSIVIIPLSLKQPWASREMIEHPPVANCGSVYLLFTSVIGLIGLILFSLAAKRYKYRTRDEGMFCQHDIEEIFDRYITQNQVASHTFKKN